MRRSSSMCVFGGGAKLEVNLQQVEIEDSVGWDSRKKSQRNTYLLNEVMGMDDISQ